jgi:hypothetical protein
MHANTRQKKSKRNNKTQTLHEAFSAIGLFRIFGPAGLIQLPNTMLFLPRYLIPYV